MINKKYLGPLLLLAVSVVAEQGTEGIGGTGAKPGDDGFGGTGRSVDMQRPELPERPELVERPEFERPENIEIERDSALELDAAEEVGNLPANTGSD